jgi:hypothetical protein
LGANPDISNKISQSEDVLVLRRDRLPLNDVEGRSNDNKDEEKRSDTLGWMLRRGLVRRCRERREERGREEGCVDRKAARK